MARLVAWWDSASSGGREQPEFIVHMRSTTGCTLLGRHAPSRCAAGSIKEWRADLSVRVFHLTARMAVAVMSAFLGTLVAEGKLERNPCTGLKKLPIVARRPRAISPLEVERIRLELPTLRDVVLVGAMAYAGLRPGEALGLSVDTRTTYRG